jgi:hypothetical protein
MTETIELSTDPYFEILNVSNLFLFQTKPHGKTLTFLERLLKIPESIKHEVPPPDTAQITAAYILEPMPLANVLPIGHYQTPVRHVSRGFASTPFADLDSAF